MSNARFPQRSFRFPTTLAIAGLCSLVILFGTMNSLSAATSARSQMPHGAAANQAWLMNEVRHQLVTLPFYSVFDNLQYSVQCSKVILSGQVTDPTLKDNAEKAVKSIEGVEAVDNRIEVLPLLPMDNDIRWKEFNAIYS
jgi:BON domain-containing protein